MWRSAVPLRRRGVEAHLLPQRVLEVLVRVDGVAALVLEVEREVAHDPHERGEVPLEVPLAWVVVLGDPDVLRQVRHERQVGDGVLVDRPQGIVDERRAEQRGQGEEPRVVVAVRLEPAEALHVQQHDRARLARRERGPDGRAPQPDAARAPPHPVADREVRACRGASASRFAIVDLPVRYRPATQTTQSLPSMPARIWALSSLTANAPSSSTSINESASARGSPGPTAGGAAAGASPPPEMSDPR